MSGRKFFEQPTVATDTVAELSKKLLIANEELKRVENERKIMLENISHDLRAPLTAIRSTVDYIKLKKSDDIDISRTELDLMVKMLDSRTKTLEVMIHDLYYLTCIDNGREAFSFNEVPLAQFLEEYFYALEIDDKYNDYELELDVPDNMDAVVSMDVDKMNRVLDNLFTNARKYSDKGSSIVLGAGQNGSECFFYVKDTGRGIPKESIPYIFDRTYRVNDARTPDSDNSSGLGLSIVKGIIYRHHGIIRCNSEVNAGSCFTVTLPLCDKTK